MSQARHHDSMDALYGKVRGYVNATLDLHDDITPEEVAMVLEDIADEVRNG